MNERYGRNAQQGGQNRYGEARGWEQGHDAPRQPQQWHDQSFGQQGGWHDDQTRDRYGQGRQGGYAAGDSRSSQADDERTRDYGQANYSQTGAGYREDRRAYGQGYGGGSGSDDYAARRDYRSEAGYGAHRNDHYGNRYGGGFRSFSGSDYGGRDFASDAPAPYGVYGGYAGADRSVYGSYGSADWDRDDYRAGRRGYGARDYGGWREYGEQRGFFERAGDEIASWFGNEDAARRREQDHRGRGPADYTRSDERIREDANDALTRDWAVDASEVTVKVQNGEVTLDGTVHSRIAKRRAEDCVEDVSGVKNVQNNLRVKNAWPSTATDASKIGKTASAGTPSTAR